MTIGGLPPKLIKQGPWFINLGLTLLILSYLTFDNQTNLMLALSSSFTAKY